MKLVCGKESKEFSEKQASDILYIQDQMKLKGWELPEDSPYQYKDNALIKRPDKISDKKETKERSTGKSNESRGSAEVSRRDNSDKE